GRYDVVLTVAAGPLHDTVSTTVTIIRPSPPVHCGETITTSVVLRADLTCPGTAIVVGANDLVIDLDGHTITGSRTGNGVEGDSHAGITVRNGTIAGFSEAVSLAHSPDDVVDSVHLPGDGILAIQ